MRTITKTALAGSALALGFLGAPAIGGVAQAQGFNVDVPGIHVHVGPHHRYYGGPRYHDYAPGYGPGYYDYRDCPRGYTVQDGVCKPYRGY
jgi:hypothetical protein